MINRELFFGAVDKLREAISKGWGDAYQHLQLDSIINIATEESLVENKTLEEDVAKLIKRIKIAKENDLMKEKAKKLIEKLKEEL